MRLSSDLNLTQPLVQLLTDSSFAAVAVFMPADSPNVPGVLCG